MYFVGIGFCGGNGIFANTFLTEVYEIYQKWIALPGMALILLILMFTHHAHARKGLGKGSEEGDGDYLWFPDYRSRPESEKGGEEE